MSFNRKMAFLPVFLSVAFAVVAGAAEKRPVTFEDVMSIRAVADAAMSPDGRAVLLFLVEVMGRHSGFIALGVCTAGGAEDIFVPEVATDFDACCERLVEALLRRALRASHHAERPTIIHQTDPLPYARVLRKLAVI
jgi:hypothetical protein